MSDQPQSRDGTGQDPSTGRFLPGNRINPGGRPKGLAALIRAKSKDGAGEELVDFQFRVFRGEVMEPVVYKGEVFEVSASIRDRRGAAEWLGDHLWGRASQTLKLEEGDAPDLSDLSEAEFVSLLERQIEALKQRRAEQAQPALPAPERQ